MAYDETLAHRVRELLIERPGYVEKKMFGGLCFLLHGNMACGIVMDQLIARVGPERYNEALSRPHASLFDFTGRPMTGWVQVAPLAWQDDRQLQEWIELGVSYALSLPAK